MPTYVNNRCMLLYYISLLLENKPESSSSLRNSLNIWVYTYAGNVKGYTYNFAEKSCHNLSYHLVANIQRFVARVCWKN